MMIFNDDLDENFFGYVSEDFKDFFFTQKFLKKKHGIETFDEIKILRMF